MKVSELGEFGLIDLLADKVSAYQGQIASRRHVILGIGDDAAAWRCAGGTILATIDSLVQDVHFKLPDVNWHDLGWKGMAINLSDIAAMGGSPGHALVALSLPADIAVADVTDLYQGMLEISREFDIALVGGNVTRAPQVSISIAVLGQAGEHLLSRSSASPGDLIAVTGHLGAAAAGLELLSGRSDFVPGEADSLKQAFLRPRPRIVEGQWLREQGVRAAIDISDGLMADLGHVCRASGVSARIEVERIPVHHAVRDGFGERALELALSGGEDYELLFTASDEVIAGLGAAPCPVTVIGEITRGRRGEVDLVDAGGRPFHLRRAGWDHFAAE